MENKELLLKNALEGDIHSFQALFAEFQQQLRSYLYRLTANRNDAEDLTHDAFIRAYDKLGLYRGESSLKTWVFQIATNLAYNLLKKRKRWAIDTPSQAKELVLTTPALSRAIEEVSTSSPFGTYDMREHIDVCFTCVSKTLLIENQVALILRDVYDFSVKEIMMILGKTEGVVKYLLQHARKTMMDVYEDRCSLVSKNGVCHQCSELNGWLNPKQDQQAAILSIQMARDSSKYDRKELYHLRRMLIRNIDPLRSKGNEIQEILMKCNRIAMGEEELPDS